ncbi:MAG: hypothetical protein ACD_3C00207G0005 [uncultured bacterium (gcode 4)]|uniref:Uncharacterized protein n=1 Tax=uncultured bacterium (gcode 4) TaxID=1234023 RepID=K2GVR3_9BACT|nr:MAG: hypothetical protein ACD_3C00207G0005 [uncultured bacterium (gcode 4)]
MKKQYAEDTYNQEKCNRNMSIDKLNQEINSSRLMFIYLLLILVVFGILWYYFSNWILEKL